jgi:SulP family sulfate permease
MAAIVVSLIALPLSMALSIATGLPPQHGLYTAIIAGTVAALLGGSRYQVSGPTAAFVVILLPIVQQYGLRGLIVAEVMAGIILILIGLARFGKLISYVPYPVTTGFTSGIAVVIGTLSLNDMLGLGIPVLEGNFVHKVAAILSAFPSASLPNALIGLLSLGILVGMGRLFPRIPATVVAVGIATLLGVWLSGHGYDIMTLGSKFSYKTHSGALGHGIPPYPPVLHLPGLKHTLYAWPSFDEFHTLLAPALVIAVLAALESLLSATVADGLSNSKHQPNAELLGIGTANILCGLAGGIPATGAIARTATNIRSGAKSPIAAVLHALLILGYVWFLAPYISYVPMASLAALLFITAYHMSHYKQFLNVIRLAPKPDVLVMLICFTLTVFIDMVVGVTVGVVLASFLFMKRMADLTETQLQKGKRSKPLVPGVKIPNDVMLYRIAGPLFFGTAEKALDRAELGNPNYKILILDMIQVPAMDLTGLVALESLILRAREHQMEIRICTGEKLKKKIMRKLPGKLKKTVVILPSVQAALQKNL